MTTRASQQPAAVVVGGVASGVAVVRSLGVHGVRIVAVRHGDTDYAHGSRYVAETVRIVAPELEEDAFVQSLVALAERLGEKAVLIPTMDENLVAIARHKTRLQHYYTVACMDWRVVERLIDKAGTYEAAARAGLAVPHTFTPESLVELRRCGEAVSYPCLVKPRESHSYARQFNRKMVKASGPQELERAWSEAVGGGHSMLVQELIPGDDTAGVNYNAYFRDGQPLAECTARKVRLSPPEIGSPRVVVTEDVPAVVELGRALLRELGVSGFANVEFKRDARDGRYVLMEVNGRHNRSALLSVRAGMEFPWLEYCDLVGLPLPRSDRYRLGLYWILGIADVKQSILQRKVERYRLRDYLRPYWRPHVFDAFAFADPGPFAVQLLGSIQRNAQRLRGVKQADAVH